MTQTIEGEDLQVMTQGDKSRLSMTFISWCELDVRVELFDCFLEDESMNVGWNP
jgi:hypothetical protein